MKELDDSKLFDIYRSGNEEAFVILYERYKPKLYLFLRNMLNYKEPEDINDYLQDVFIKVIKNANKYKKKYAFSTWIYRIARNYVYDIYRKNGKIVYDTDKVDEKFSVDHSRDDKESILYYLNKLSLEQREIILLRVEGFSFKEIAKMLFIPEKTAITRNARGIKKLKEFLNEN